MCKSTPPADPGDDREEVMQDYERYRAEYERLRDDLLRRDRRAEQDPFTLQRWPRERKAYADKVDRALLNWETYGHRAQVEAASGALGRPGDGEHDEIDDEPRLPDRRPLHHSTTTSRCLATP